VDGQIQPSPRLWETRHHHGIDAVDASTIPTPVGEPRPGRPRSSPATDYPHARGRTSRAACSSGLSRRLSPHSWVNLAISLFPTRQCPTIPTPVGEPFLGSMASARTADYPHPRGRTCTWCMGAGTLTRLSPRPWENRHRPDDFLKRRPTIPTPVGEPTSIKRWMAA